MTWREALRSLPAAVPAEELAAAIGELEAAKATLYARLVNGRVEPKRPASPPAEPDRLLDVDDAASLLGVTTRWVYDHADELPFTRRIGPRTLRFSERGLRRFMQTRR